MVMTLELPERGLDETPRPAAAAPQESPIAAAAAEAVESGPSPVEVTIRITKPVDLDAMNFHAVAGETMTAVIDEAGAPYIPWGEEDGIYLDADEFEIVEPLEQTEGNENGNDQATAVEPAAEGGCAGGETPTVKPSDQPATGNTQAEPATPPVMPIAADAKKDGARWKYLREKSGMEERLSALMIEEMKLKEQAKLCKKEREVLAEQLANLIDDWERGDENTADVAPTATAKAPANAGADQRGSSPDAEPASQPGPQEDAAVAVETTPASQEDGRARYRNVLEAASVAELSLPPKVEERLIESGATSIWLLEQLRGDISQGKAKWPKGIGAAKVTQIEDALLAWMSRNQQTWDTGEAARDAEVAQTSVDHAKPQGEQELEPAAVAEAKAESTAEHDPLDDL